MQGSSQLGPRRWAMRPDCNGAAIVAFCLGTTALLEAKLVASVDGLGPSLISGLFWRQALLIAAVAIIPASTRSANDLLLRAGGARPLVRPLRRRVITQQYWQECPDDKHKNSAATAIRPPCSLSLRLNTCITTSPRNQIHGVWLSVMHPWVGCIRILWPWLQRPAAFWLGKDCSTLLSLVACCARPVRCSLGWRLVLSV